MNQENRSIFLRALSGERTSRPPIWFMRQAGRYMSEYQAIRSKHPMLEVIRTPELAAEVTLQPIRKFSPDAAIIFADILNPLIGMGVQLDFVEGEGPRIANPITSEKDVDGLVVPAPEENVGYTLEALKMVRSALKPEVALIGFSGAPLTLSAYLIEGKGPKDGIRLKTFIREHPGAWEKLQNKLSELVIEYAVAQAAAGADCIQLFDSWAGILSPGEFYSKSVPFLRIIIDAIQVRTKKPVIYFPVGNPEHLRFVPALRPSAVGVDWRVSLTRAQSLVGPHYPLQGNLDPTTLFSSWETVKREALRVMEEGRGLRSHIFNLGHGILPKTPVENVGRLIDLVKGVSV